MASNFSIYGLKREGVLVYIGRSGDVKRRLVHHKSRGIKFDSVEILATCSPEDSRGLEEQFIAKHNPSENKTRHGTGSLPKGGLCRRAINLYLSPEVKAAAIAHAEARDMSLSTFVERLMRRAVSRNYKRKAVA